jgi:hypothetical protein
LTGSETGLVVLGAEGDLALGLEEPVAFARDFGVVVALLVAPIRLPLGLLS